MSPQTRSRFQIICAWSGMVFAILYPICWAWLGHTRPAISPTLSATEVATFYLRHHNDILFGMTAAAVVGALWIPWTAQLTITMRRIEGSEPVLTIVQLIGGALTAWVLVFTPAIWATAAFRPSADPDVIRSLSDIAYMTFTLTYAVTSVQAIAAGLVGLADAGPRPVFPIWVSWFAILTGISFLMVSCVAFFLTGPMALDGAIVSGLPGTAYFVWTLSMGVCMVRESHRRARAALVEA